MRLKIIAGNLAAVLFIGIFSYVAVRGQLRDALIKQVTTQIAGDATLFDRSWQLSAHQFADSVEDRASDESVRSALSSVGDSRRRRAFESANAVSDWFRDPARGRGGPPTIVAITDSAGVVLARNQDMNRLHGESLVTQVPTLAKSLADGTARHDVWFKKDEGKLLQVAVAPIRNDQGAIVGGLVVGYDLSAAFASSEAKLLGRDVAFITSDAVYSSSLSNEVRESLRAFLFGAEKATTNSVVTRKQALAEWAGDFGGASWVGVTAPLAMTSSVPVGYVVVGNKSAAAELASVVNLILVLTALGVIIVLVYGFAVGTMFLRPVEQIEEGVLAVINGNTDLRLDVESDEFGGLAYRINQLINVFTGVSEGDDGESLSAGEGGEAGAWSANELQASASVGGATSGAAAGEGAGGVVDDPAVAARLSAEPEAAYAARIYKEYVAAKTAAGESVANLTQERFVERLTRNAETLTKKHGVRAVRFIVEVNGTAVALKPVLIR